MPSVKPQIDPRIPLATIPLRPEEELVFARLVAPQDPLHPLSALEALQLLAGVDKPEDIGKAGPVKASAALPENQSISELRRYEVVFGRDSLITALLVFDQFPLLTRATVKRLSELQGGEFDEASEEEPGKIVHEARPATDPIAPELIEKWGWGLPYYGTVDATPLFISAAARYITFHDDSFRQEIFTGRDGKSRTIEQAIQAALHWLTQKLDRSPDGLLEIQRLNKIGGLVAQSWKDTPDGHHHADGSLVNFDASISSIDAQAVAYDALHDAAALFPTLASELEARAAKLQKNVLEKFWVEDADGKYFALGSERDKGGSLRLLKIRTSNMGHLLNSRLLEEEKYMSYRQEIVKTLFSPNLMSRAGIRTLGSHENRYRPYAYHNGSVWPWDNYWISLGLLRHGYVREAEEIWQKILMIAQTTKRFPELVCGDDTLPLIAHRLIKAYDTRHHFVNTIEQPPQELQAWTVASVLATQHKKNQYGSLPK